MATLTITESDGVYSVSPDPITVPEGGSLTIVVPVGPPAGCLICLDKDLGGSRSHALTQDKTFDLKDKPANTVWGYDVFAPTASCPEVRKRNAAHSIQVGSGKR